MADGYCSIVSEIVASKNKAKVAPKGKAKAKEAIELSDGEIPEFSECVFSLHLQNVMADVYHSIISEIVASKSEAKVKGSDSSQ